jgi:hypothetical protein
MYMPDSSGTDTTQSGTDQTAPPAGGQPAGANGGDASGTQGGGAEGRVNPQLQRRLSDENASLRVKNRTLTEQHAAYQEFGTPDDIRAVIARVNASPGEDAGLKATVAKLERTISELNTKVRSEAEARTQLEQKARSKMIQAGISKITSETRIVDPEGAAQILERYASIDDDDVMVFNVKDKDGTAIKVPATGESVREYKLLKDHFFPAEGASGTGSRGTRPVGASVDLERAKTDLKYYETNRPAIIAERKRLQRAS